MGILGIARDSNIVYTIRLKTKSNETFQANMDLSNIGFQKEFNLSQSHFVGNEKSVATHFISSFAQNLPTTQIQSPKADVLVQLLRDSTFINTAKTSQA